MDHFELIQTLRNIFIDVEFLEVSATSNEILVTLEHLVNYDHCQRVEYDLSAAELYISHLKLLFTQLLSILGQYSKSRKCFTSFLAHVCESDLVGYWHISDF